MVEWILGFIKVYILIFVFFPVTGEPGLSEHGSVFNFNLDRRALSLFDLPSLRMKKRQMFLKTRMVSFYKRSKHWITYNLNPRACFCLTKCG